MASVLSTKGVLVGGVVACQASKSRSKWASFSVLANRLAKVDLPLAELPKINTFLNIYSHQPKNYVS